MLLQQAFYLLCKNRGLAQLLSMNDVVNLAMSATFLKDFREQIPVLLVEGANCISLKHLRKYLKKKQKHIHAKLFVDEILDVQFPCPSRIQTLLLQPCAMNWNPYAILRNVSFLHDFVALEHLELSLNSDSAFAFNAILRSHLPALKALVVSTNEPVPGFWRSITHQPRPSLVSLSVNNFLLENVPLHNVKNISFLWISRPIRYRGHALFLRRVCDNLHKLVYFSTIDFKGFRKRSEMEACLQCLEGETLPSLQYWEVDGSDVVHTSAMVQSLPNRRRPLTVQGLCMRDACVPVPPGHRLLSGRRDVSLQNPRIYRSLEVLGHVVQTRIPTATGFAYLRGRNV